MLSHSSVTLGVGAHLHSNGHESAVSCRHSSVTWARHLPYTAVTFPAIRLVPNYSGWLQRHLCEQLVKCCYLMVEWLGIEPVTLRSLVRHANS